MFDVNDFKKRVKEWMNSHPQAEAAELRDFCEEIIPPPQFSANRWLVEQTLSWYLHIVQNRSRANVLLDDGEED